MRKRKWNTISPFVKCDRIRRDEQQQDHGKRREILAAGDTREQFQELLDNAGAGGDTWCRIAPGDNFDVAPFREKVLQF